MPESPSPALMRALEAVTEQGSYTAAGRRIGVSHSAISQQIRRFEESHGRRLFERVEGRLSPTPFCQALGELAERLREIGTDYSRLIARRDASGQMRMRVGLGNSMPGVAIIGQVIVNHPNVSVTVQTGAHQAILGAVLRREVDVAVLPDIPPDGRFRRQPVLAQEVVAIVAEGHPLAAESDVSLDQLAGHALIFRGRGSSTQRVVDRAFARAGLHPEPRLIADTRDAVYEAVSLGIGIGFMWRLGTHRSDAVRRLMVRDIGQGSEEVVFALSEDRNPLADIFFLAATAWGKSMAARRSKLSDLP